VGTIVGARYRIEGVLGEGGMAIVYRARHTRTGKMCALKLVHRHLVSRPELVELFVREAQIAGRIGEHPNIVNVFDADVDDTWKIPFIAMELLNGHTLEQHVSQYGPLPRDVFRKVFEQLADALEQAHRAGVIHRDLKPSNLILTHDRKDQPVLKVMDFGIAKVLEQGSQRTATHIGSPAYAAPEQQSGAAMRKIAASQGITIATGVSPATDVWALGLIAYELLTGLSSGHFWSHAEGLNDLLLKIALETPLPASARAGDRASLLPRGFDQWLERCLQKNAAARWQSVGEAVEHLLQLPFLAPTALGSTIRIDPAMLPSSPGPAPPNPPGAYPLSNTNLLRLPQAGVGAESDIVPSSDAPTQVVASPLRGSDTVPSSDAPTRVVASPLRESDVSPGPREAPGQAQKDAAARPSPALAPHAQVLTPPPVFSEAPTRILDKRSLADAPANTGPPMRWALKLPLAGSRWASTVKDLAIHPASVVTAGALVVTLTVLVGRGLVSSDPSSDNAGAATAGAPSTAALSTGERASTDTAPPPSTGTVAAESADSSPTPTSAPSSAQQAGAPAPTGDGSGSKPKPTPQMATSKLRVSSKNGSCRVTVNGTAKGYTPLDLDLPVGSYDVGCNTVGWKSTQKMTVSAGKITLKTFIVPR
jgi:serine/threonine-protein kinase